MDIDSEHLGIPTTVYDATISMPSAEFARICRDLSILGESVKIEAFDDSVRFFSEGDIGNASIVLKPTAAAAAPSRANSTQTQTTQDRKPKVKPDPVELDDEVDEAEDVKPKTEKKGNKVCLMRFLIDILPD